MIDRPKGLFFYYRYHRVKLGRKDFMADFTPITTQEEFNAAIGERIKREKETISQKYSDYEDLKNKTTEYEKQIGELNRAIEDSGKKYADYDTKLADLQSKVSEYESSSVKTRIAHEVGIPYELAGRLSGKTEDEIRKDAESLSKLIGTQHAAPLKSTETAVEDPKKSALKNLAKNLTGGN